MCRNPDPNTHQPVPCDLFPLSWTLTPGLPKSLLPNAVWNLARTADHNLAGGVNDITVPNPENQTLNLMNVDYGQYARVADVALYLNFPNARSSVSALPSFIG